MTLSFVNLADAAVAKAAISKYQSKKSKSINILSSLHLNIAIPLGITRNGIFYNKTEVGGNVSKPTRWRGG